MERTSIVLFVIEKSKKQLSIFFRMPLQCAMLVLHIPYLYGRLPSPQGHLFRAKLPDAANVHGGFYDRSVKYKDGT